MVIVPPGGFTGFAQMTPASQRSLFRPGKGRSSGTRKRKRTSKSRVRSKRSPKRARKLKFGSPAWRKKYMK
jgi:hypothetical protein